MIHRAQTVCVSGSKHLKWESTWLTHCCFCWKLEELQLLELQLNFSVLKVDAYLTYKPGRTWLITWLNKGETENRSKEIKLSTGSCRNQKSNAVTETVFERVYHPQHQVNGIITTNTSKLQTTPDWDVSVCRWYLWPPFLSPPSPWGFYKLIILPLIFFLSVK